MGYADSANTTTGQGDTGNSRGNAVLIGPHGGVCDAGCTEGPRDGDLLASSVSVVKVSAPRPTNPANVNAYFDDMYVPIHLMAGRMRTDEDFLFVLSSMESGWLNAHNRSLHNAWGLTKAGGNNLSFDSFHAGTDYFEKNSQWGKRLQGIQTIDDFVKELLTPPKYNSVNPNYESLIRWQYNSIIKQKEIWSEQKD